MYESRKEAVLSTGQFVLRMLRHIGIALVIIVVGIGVGMAGHMWFEPVRWHDAILNVSMMLAGLGPFIPPETVAGKLFFAGYNVVVGLVFVALLGVVMAPVLHRVIHKFHLDED